MVPPTLESRCKFAILAAQNVRADVPCALVLQDGTRVLEKFPFSLDAHWSEWLGSIQLQNLDSCNVFLVRTATEGWQEGQLHISGDEIDAGLQRQVGSLFAMLRLLGPIEYANAFVLAGY